MSGPNVLETIRQAYRYIVAYERRVIDAIAAVDTELRSRQFERYGRSVSLHTEWPSRSKALEKWAWDNVPNYARRFQWTSGKPNAAGNRWVVLDHIADTSFENRRLDVPKGRPTLFETWSRWRRAGASFVGSRCRSRGPSRPRPTTERGATCSPSTSARARLRSASPNLSLNRIAGKHRR